MIEIEVPADIREYEPTLIGPLTTRQTVSVVVTGCVVYAVYMIEKAVGITDPSTVPVFLFFGVPPFLVGFMPKMYGMYVEKFIGRVYRDNFAAPKNRPYKVENMWDGILEEERKASAIQARKNGKENAGTVKPTPRAKLPEELRAYR